MRLGVDSDGVLADFDKSLIDGYNEAFGTDLKYKQITHWDAFEELTGWTHKQWWDWVVKDHPRIFLDAPPLPGALAGMQALRARGHELCIITAKPNWAAAHMVEWLHKHDIPYDELHITSKKSYVECDVYVDDGPHNLIDFKDNTDALAIQYAPWPYVNNGEIIDGCTYCTSWDEIVKEIDNWQTLSESRVTQARAKMKQHAHSLRQVIHA